MVATYMKANAQSDFFGAASTKSDMEQMNSSYRSRISSWPQLELLDPTPISDCSDIDVSESSLLSLDNFFGDAFDENNVDGLATLQLTPLQQLRKNNSVKAIQTMLPAPIQPVDSVIKARQFPGPLKKGLPRTISNESKTSDASASLGSMVRGECQILWEQNVRASPSAIARSQPPQPSQDKPTPVKDLTEQFVNLKTALEKSRKSLDDLQSFEFYVLGLPRCHSRTVSRSNKSRKRVIANMMSPSETTKHKKRKGN